MSFTVDSNVLVYAIDSSAGHKHEVALSIMISGRDAGLLLTAQAVAECLNVIRRKFPQFQDEARKEVGRWSILYSVLSTKVGDVMAAERFASMHRLQLWDCLIWKVASAGGARLFISEDLQDGLSLDGLIVMNPFNPANEFRLRALLKGERE